jgi:hypothetical protein
MPPLLPPRLRRLYVVRSIRFARLDRQFVAYRSVSPLGKIRLNSGTPAALKTALAAKLQMSVFGLERLKLVIAGRDAIAHMSHNVRSGRAWAPGLRDRRAQVSSGLGGCRSDETAPRAGHGGGHCANGIPWYFCGFEGQFANLRPQSVAPMADSGTRRSA